MEIKMVATFEEIWWEEEEEHHRIGGFTDPENPWGGFKYELPEDVYGEAAKAWMAENVKVVTFDNVREAAEFVLNFPGGVWDADIECDPCQNWTTGHDTTVMLHIETFADEVFDELEKLNWTRVRSSDVT